LKEGETLIYVVVGIAVGAMAVYIFLSTMMKTTITDLTRDSEGRIISIVERRV